MLQRLNKSNRKLINAAKEICKVSIEYFYWINPLPFCRVSKMKRYCALQYCTLHSCIHAFEWHELPALSNEATYEFTENGCVLRIERYSWGDMTMTMWRIAAASDAAGNGCYDSDDDDDAFCQYLHLWVYLYLQSPFCTYLAYTYAGTEMKYMLDGLCVGYKFFDCSACVRSGCMASCTGIKCGVNKTSKRFWVDAVVYEYSSSILLHTYRIFHNKIAHSFTCGKASLALYRIIFFFTQHIVITIFGMHCRSLLSSSSQYAVGWFYAELWAQA